MIRTILRLSVAARIALVALIALSAVVMAPRAGASAAKTPALDSGALFATGPGGARPPSLPTDTPEPTATSTKTSAKKTATPEPTSTKTSATKPSKPVLKDNVYTGANKAFTVTFDASLWTAEALPPTSDGYEGVKLSSDSSLAWVEVLSTSLSLDECVSGSIANLGKESGFSNVVATDQLTAPTTAKGGSGTMITFTLTSDTGASDFTGYVECRALVKGKSVIRAEFLTAMTRLDQALPTWTDLLGGIKLAKTSGTGKATATATPKPKKTPKATATSTSANTFPDVKGSTFTSPAFGFTFTWPSKFIPILASGDDSGDVVAISDGTSTVLLFSKSTDDGTTAKSCLDDKEQALINSTTLTNVVVATDKSGKELRGKTTSGLYVLYSYTDKDGVPEYDYLRCDLDPSGAYVLDLTFISPQSEFGATADDLTAIIDGIKFP